VQNLLFICGTPRAGTSELCRIINKSPECAIGMERFYYKAAPNTKFELNGSLFEKKRFFDVIPGDTFHSGNFYKGMHEKYQSCKYVGDKIPLLSHHLSKLPHSFSDRDFKVIFCLRNPFDLSNSYLNRLHNPQDNWNHGIERAASDFNNALRSLSNILASDNASKVIVLEYESTFFNPTALPQLFRALEINISNELSNEFINSLSKSKELSLKRTTNSLSSHDARKICSSFDFALYKQIIQHAFC
tara:strand:+ start:25 stop:759 length:735 start_codon:yes stop_codon:yes gene_type:complete